MPSRPFKGLLCTGSLIVLRHGETTYNEAHLLSGQADVPLTAKGKEEARSAGRLLALMPIDAVFSSTLSRAYQTAVIALETLHAERDVSSLKAGEDAWRIVQCDDLVERHTGDFTGLNKKTDPVYQAFVDGYDVKYPGGESVGDVVARLERFFELRVRAHLVAGQSILVVAHAGVVRGFDYFLGCTPIPQAGVPGVYRKEAVQNARPIVYKWDDSGRVQRCVLAE